VSRRSATRWFHAGVLAVPARQLSTGTILVDEPVPVAAAVAVYARVLSADQRGDLDRQVARLVGHVTTSGMSPTKVVFEVGSGLSGHRTKLLGLLRDATVGIIVVEHRDRLARLGVEYLEAALAAQGRQLVVVEDSEVTDDVVGDMVEVLASFCARLCGRRSAKRRAETAMAAAVKAAAGRRSSGRSASSWIPAVGPVRRWPAMLGLPGSRSTGVGQW
jgi:putative resolvase